MQFYLFSDRSGPRKHGIQYFTREKFINFFLIQHPSKIRRMGCPLPLFTSIYVVYAIITVQQSVTGRSCYLYTQVSYTKGGDLLGI